jgi:hypothetical protein
MKETKPPPLKGVKDGHPKTSLITLGGYIEMVSSLRALSRREKDWKDGAPVNARSKAAPPVR